MNGEHYDAKAIESARRARGSRREVAEIIDVKEMTLFRVEKGHSASYELILKLCREFDLDPRKVLRFNSEAVI
jgi:DNA-binding XRE family transcriptional regulator